MNLTDELGATLHRMNGFETRLDPPETIIWQDGKGEEIDQPRLNFAVGLIGRITNETGDVVSHVAVSLKVPGQRCRHVAYPVSAMAGQDLTGRILRTIELPVTMDEARHMSRWLTQATRAEDAPKIQMLAHPAWHGSQLLIPGVGKALPLIGAPQYGPDPATMHDEEDDAYNAWRRVVMLAAQNPKAALVLGAAAVSPFLPRIGQRNGFAVNLGGDSTLGKTQMAETAISIYAHPISQLVRDSWDGTYAGIMARLKQTGGLPYLLDELSLDGLTNAVKVTYAVSQGIERARADREGEARESERFTLVLLSTGEATLAGTSANTGARARVLELAAPVFADREDSDLAFQLATTYFGWPIHWIIKRNLAVTPVDYGAALNHMATLYVEDPLVRRLVPQFAAAAAGFDLLRRALDISKSEAPIRFAGILEELTRSLVNAPVSDRVYILLYQHLVSSPGRYAPTSIFGQDMSGKDLGGSWCVLPTVAKELCDRAGIQDLLPAMRGLRDKGVLIPDGGSLQRRQTMNGKQVRTYTLRADPEALQIMGVDDIKAQRAHS